MKCILNFAEEEDIASLNPNLLLYKASAAHNLPVMCHAIALGAVKNWINEDDSKRTPLHQAVLSVSSTCCTFKRKKYLFTSIIIHRSLGLRNGL